MADNIEPSAAEKSAIEKLTRAQARREKKLANLRVVYTYRHKATKELTDNLVLLPAATREGHLPYLEHCLASIPRETLKQMTDFEVVKIGVFDKLRLVFTSRSPVVVIKISPFLKYLESLNNNN